MDTLTRTPWFDIQKNGLPVRDGLYEVRDRRRRFPTQEWVFIDYQALWKNGAWHNYDKPLNILGLKVNILNISAPPTPDYWRGVVCDENYPISK